ncbi:Uu.00g113350.m01.CDS01 [Anthostomella pinea]|uniref:Uu.00g113350.m01.CDS01 n=1 Tax=Anthostomella pinea TaxID=933095 RepID=A0AAI8VG56_9PEZI|nr:Uu.00g113350.m01.CDS01 [Anthostomella pinea]
MSQPPRRSSFGMLLRRSKSGDLGKGGRKQQRDQHREPVPKSPPRLPALYNGAQPQPLQSFGGDNRPDSLAIVSGTADHSFHRYPPRASIDPERPSMSSSVANPPVPPIPSGNWVDPYARTESMTHRGRYSYASSAISTINSPRRVRRRKDPTPFNILIIGTNGSGKTSFLEFLKTSLALPAKKKSQRTTEIEQEVARATPSGNFIPHYLESEMDGERVGLTLWDSEGLVKNMVDLQLREMSSFVESKFEETFAEERKVIRSPGVQDTHIHAVFLVLDPARLDRNIAAAKSSSANGHHGRHAQDLGRIIGGLDEDLDLQVMRTLQGKTTVIPVISKADTITTAHMAVLKKTVWSSLKKANFDPLEALGLDDDDDDATPDSSRIDEAEEGDENDEAVESDAEEEKLAKSTDASDDADASPEDEDLPIQGRTSASTKRKSNNSVRRPKPSEEDESDELPILPMSIISPDLYEPAVIGRKFPWGFADPYDPEHCDFTRLREAVFSEWRGELRVASKEQWYEGWRTSRLKHREPSTRRR